jgi:hypothetical protein
MSGSTGAAHFDIARLLSVHRHTDALTVGEKNQLFVTFMVGHPSLSSHHGALGLCNAIGLSIDFKGRPVELEGQVSFLVRLIPLPFHLHTTQAPEYGVAVISDPAVDPQGRYSTVVLSGYVGVTLLGTFSYRQVHGFTVDRPVYAGILRKTMPIYQHVYVYVFHINLSSAVTGVFCL